MTDDDGDVVDDEGRLLKILRFFAVETDGGHAFPIQIVQACGRTQQQPPPLPSPTTRDPSAPPTALTVI